jgi:hypothetical protein
LPNACEPLREAILEQHQELLGPLFEVLSEASKRVKDMAGGP